MRSMIYYLEALDQSKARELGISGGMGGALAHLIPNQLALNT
jgi:hypothetical protein